MPKVITQETFDEVVRENIEEFEMSAAEAIEDAVKQFEAQDVNLANIVQDLSLYNSSGGDGPLQYPIVAAIQALDTALESEQLDSDTVKTQCNKIKEECELDLAHKLLAGKNGGYLALYKAMQKTEKNTELFPIVIETMSALCNGQPDLLEMRGVYFLLKALQTYNEDADIALKLVKLIRLTCVMHETNRQGFVNNGLISSLMAVMETHKANADIVKETCFALRVLTLDDDVRVPFGKAHEHAKMIVTETGAIKKILDLCNDYMSNRPVLGELYATLTTLAVRNEFCQEVLDLGGLAMILNTLEHNMNHQQIIKQVMAVMKTLAGNDQVKRVIVESGGVELILTAMNKHAKCAPIQVAGCSAIATVSLRNPIHCQRVMECNGPETILKAMQLHPTEVQVQKQACMAVRNVVARTKEYSSTFLALGAESLLQQAMTGHESCHDEAKAALRDLECKVELKELWKGEGKGIKY